MTQWAGFSSFTRQPTFSFLLLTFCCLDLVHPPNHLLMPCWPTSLGTCQKSLQDQSPSICPQQLYSSQSSPQSCLMFSLRSVKFLFPCCSLTRQGVGDTPMPLGDAQHAAFEFRAVWDYFFFFFFFFFTTNQIHFHTGFRSPHSTKSSLLQRYTFVCWCWESSCSDAAGGHSRIRGGQWWLGTLVTTCFCVLDPFSLSNVCMMHVFLFVFCICSFCLDFLLITFISLFWPESNTNYNIKPLVFSSFRNWF